MATLFFDERVSRPSMTNDDITALLRQSAIDYLGTRPPRRTDPGVVPDFDRDGWKGLAELGWLGLALPESLGGAGLGLAEATVLAEQFGRQPSDVSWIAGSLLPGLLLARLPDGEGHRQLAAELVSGRRPLALAWQEQPGHQGERQPQTCYRGGRVSGVKRFVPCVSGDAILLVTADREGSLTVLAVDSQAPGVEVSRHASGLGHEATIRLDNAPVLHELANGPLAAAALATTLAAGRIALSAQLAGVAAGVLDKTLAYVGTRVQFGKPISAFQAIRHRCVDQSIAVRLAQASWRCALRCHERDPLSAETTRAVSAAKARCGDVAFQVSKEAVQMHGGMGFTEECGVGAYLRAALHGRAWLGSSLAHRRSFMAHHPLFREAAHD